MSAAFYIEELSCPYCLVIGTNGQVVCHRSGRPGFRQFGSLDELAYHVQRDHPGSVMATKLAVRP